MTHTPDTGLILVTGATGRLGQTVLARLGEHGVAGQRQCDVISNRIMLIDSDGTVDRAALQGVSAIINCAGRVHGSLAEIDQANIMYPAALARAARDAGVARFVQVSSFSVHGRIEYIDTNTPVAPIDGYGQSKATAEQMLQTLTTANFRPISVRLPFMFNAAHPALLGQLVALLLRVHLLPTPISGPALRSMINYDAAAETLIALANQSAAHDGCAALAADPSPLALPTLARAIRDHLGRRVAILPLPTAMTKLAELIAPAAANRLFRSSVLDPTTNIVKSAPAISVERELLNYLHRLSAARSAGQHHER